MASMQIPSARGKFKDLLVRRDVRAVVYTVGTYYITDSQGNAEVFLSTLTRAQARKAFVAYVRDIRNDKPRRGHTRLVATLLMVDIRRPGQMSSSATIAQWTSQTTNDNFPGLVCGGDVYVDVVAQRRRMLATTRAGQPAPVLAASDFRKVGA